MNNLSMTRRWPLPAAIAGLTVLCGFILPYAFPPSQIAYGQSYVVGFNNHLAMVSFFAISLAIFAVGLSGRIFTKPAGANGTANLGLFHLVLASLVVLAWCGSLIWLMRAAVEQTHESSFFIGQMEKTFYQHKSLYAQVDYPYGPLLFWPTIWLAHLFHSSQYPVESAYYITLIAHLLLGESMLYVVLCRLPLSRAVRLSAFYILSLYSLNPMLALNYTLFRFLLPFFCLTMLARISRPLLACLWIFLTVPAVFFTSQEMGDLLLCGRRCLQYRSF